MNRNVNKQHYAKLMNCTSSLNFAIFGTSLENFRFTSTRHSDPPPILCFLTSFNR